MEAKTIVEIGISDISSSEAKLERFSKVCVIIRARPGQSRLALYRSFKLLGIINKKIVDRHIAISEKLDLIRRHGEAYGISANGKAISAFASERGGGTLTVEERALYFRILMRSLAKTQLLELLLAVQGEQSGLRRDVIVRFFRTDFAQRLWEKEVIERNLRKMGANAHAPIPRFFVHKFGCLQGWLRDLSVIGSSSGRLFLTDGVGPLLSKIRNCSDNDIYHLAARLYFGTAREFDYEIHKEIYVDLFRKAFSLFGFETGASDVKSIRTYVCVRSLLKGIILEEKTFDNSLRLLSIDRIIRSVILGRDGKPHSVTLYRAP